MNATIPLLAALGDRLITCATRADWLAERMKDDRVGASDVPALLGLHPQRTAYGVWAAKYRPDTVDEGPDAADAARGHAFEATVLRLWSVETGREVQAFDNAIVLHATERWACMSPDGITIDGEPVEAKTTRHGDGWPESGPLFLSDAPDRRELWAFVAQCAWEAAVLGADRAHLAVLLPWYDLRVYTIETPASLRSALLSRVGAWRDRHLVGGEEPEQGRPLSIPRGWEQDAKARPSDALPEADDETWALVEVWRAASAAAKAAETAKEEAAAALVARLDAAQLTGVRRGKAVARFQVTASSERVAALSKLPDDVVAFLRDRGAITTTTGSRHVRASGF